MFFSSWITSSALHRLVPKCPHFLDVCHPLWVTSQHSLVKWVHSKSASHPPAAARSHRCRLSTYLQTTLPTQHLRRPSPTSMQPPFSSVTWLHRESSLLWIHWHPPAVSSHRKSLAKSTTVSHVAFSPFCSATKSSRTSSRSSESMSFQMTIS